MDMRMNLTSREQALTLELMEALTSSLELPQVFARAQGVLSRLFSADSLALCVSKPDRPSEYDWMVTEAQAAFFLKYPELAAEDFVRDAVVRRPNVVLRDSEMVPRRVLVESALYRRFRELGTPLEHAMAVLLGADRHWHGGLTLYRERPRPFSPRDQALLQKFTRSLVGAVRNCRVFGEVSTRGHILDTLFQYQGAGVVVLAPPAIEQGRTPLAERLLETWFRPSERDASGLPRALVDKVKQLEASEELGADTWVQKGNDKSLKVSFVRLPAVEGKRLWALLLKELPHVIPLPADWLRRLSAREAEVTSRVVLGWDNKLIAHDLRIAEGTVKKHMQSIFDKLGVESRAMLIHLAVLS